MSFLRHIRACNRWDPADFLPWQLDGETLGWVRPAFALQICALGLPVCGYGDGHAVFELAGDVLHWRAEGLDQAGRSALLERFCAELHRQDVLPAPQGESYPVTPDRRDQARCVIDRAYAPWFGTRAFGQHLNGYVRVNHGIELWVARRALDRRHYPGYLDNTVAGGLPHGVNARENLRKECREEAGLTVAIADQARPVSAISYCRAARAGLKPDLMYCYDLELPADLIPCCTDGEVAGFERWPVERVMEAVRTTNDFKLNCNLVIIDFLLRHGFIDPDDPDYVELIRGLRSPLPVGPTPED